MQVTKQDVVKIIAMIRINFENAYKGNASTENKILVDSWFDILQDYPKEIVIAAVKNSLKFSEFAPRIGTIVKEIERLQEAVGKDDNALWSELVSALKEVDDCVYRFRFTYREANGLTQGENARRRVEEIFNDLSDELKAFVHNQSTLIELSKYTGEQLSFERGRFMKNMPTVRERMKIIGDMSDDIKNMLQGVCKPMLNGGNQNG